VREELVAEDKDRRASAIASCSESDEALVEGSSERLVVTVGDAVYDDCVNFVSSSMFESCSWLAIDEILELVSVVLTLDCDRVGVCAFEGVEQDADAL
jgi:hypothetical protein